MSTAAPKPAQPTPPAPPRIRAQPARPAPTPTPRTTTVKRPLPGGTQRIDRFMDGRLIQTKELKAVAKPKGPRLSLDPPVNVAG